MQSRTYRVVTTQWECKQSHLHALDANCTVKKVIHTLRFKQFTCIKHDAGLAYWCKLHESKYKKGPMTFSHCRCSTYGCMIFLHNSSCNLSHPSVGNHLSTAGRRRCQQQTRRLVERIHLRPISHSSVITTCSDLSRGRRGQDRAVHLCYPVHE